MSIPGILQLVIYGLAVILITKPLGLYMANVFSGDRTWLTLVLAPVERGIYRATGVDPDSEQGWVGYTFAMLFFSVVGAVSLYAIMRLQNILPFNPQGLDAVSPDLAFNTAMSFVTNTNWQSYTPETTMSYFTQMAGLPSTTGCRRRLASPSPWRLSAALRGVPDAGSGTSG